MADKVTIINRAFSLLGAEPISDLTENTPEAKIANRMYDESRKSVLSERQWSFATKRVILNQIVATLPFELDGVRFIFQLPSDVIRIFRISSNASIWRIEGETLLSNENTIGIQYVFDQTDTTKYSASFTDAFADKLASDMAYAILNSNTEAKLLLEKYNGVSLPKATAEDSQQGTSYEIRDDLWVNAKFGFSPVGNRGSQFA